MSNATDAYTAAGGMVAIGCSSGNQVAIVGGVTVALITVTYLTYHDCISKFSLQVCYDFLDGALHWFHNCEKKDATTKFNRFLKTKEKMN